MELPPVAHVQRLAEQAPLHASQRVTQEQAQAALARLQGTLKATRFTAAWPSELPGMVAVQMESGEVGYTDKTGRYFVLGLVLDTATGAALDKQLDGNH